MKNALLVWLLIATVSGRTQTGLYVPELAHFDTVMNHILSDFEIEGGQLAITYEGRLVYNRGFGWADTTEHTLVEPESIFRLASVSKSITSIAVMKLMEDGLLNLDDMVIGPGAILDDPMYTGAIDERVYDITVQQLLDHSAGFDFVFDEEPLWKTYDIAVAYGLTPPTYSFELVLQWTLENMSLGFNPGTAAFYSNFGYTLLGLVVQELSGMDYETYVRDSILAPLGIDDMHAGRTLAADKFPNEVSYYEYPGAPLSTSIFTGVANSVPAPYGGYNWEIMTPAGGWVASAADLCRLLLAVDGFNTKPDILSSGTLATMTQASTYWPAYALGWFVEGNEYWNNGGIQGTATTFECDGDHEITYSILFNTLPEDYVPFYGAFVQIVSQDADLISEWPTHDLFEPAVSIHDQEMEPALRVAPNPATGYIILPGWVGEVAIFNLQGAMVWSGLVYDGQAIDMSACLPGIYIVDANGQYTSCVLQ